MRWLLLVVLAAGSLAHAQARPLSAEEFAACTRCLSLTDRQRAELLRLHDGYQHEFRRREMEQADADAAVRAALSQLEREDRRERDELTRSRTALQGRASGQLRALERQLFDDVLVLLDDSQVAQWPEVQRIRRKTRYLVSGVEVPGAWVDLTGVVDDLDVPATPRLDSLILEYDLKLDELLQNRETNEARTIDLHTRGLRMSRSDELITPEQQREIDDLETDRLRNGFDVLALNTRYTDRFASVLPPERVPAFRDAVEVAWSGEYARSDHELDTVYRRVLAIQTLTDEQRASITRLHERYLAEVKKADLRRARLEIEETAMSRRVKLGWAQQQDADDARARMDEMIHEYEEASVRGLARLRTELTSTQIREAGLTELFESRTYDDWCRRLQRLERRERDGLDK